MGGLLAGLLVFLVGCLVIAVIIWVVNLLAGMLTMPAEIKQIGLLIFSLIMFVILLILAYNAATGGVNWWGPPPVR